MENLTRRATPLIVLGTASLVVAILYWARPVLMPLSLAVLLTFLLTPIVEALCRKGLRQTFAVGLAVLMVFSALGTITFGIGQQLTTLAEVLPEYEDNIREKVSDLRSIGKGKTLQRVQSTLRHLQGEIKERTARGRTSKSQVGENPAEEPSENPVPVQIVGDRDSVRRIVPAALGPAFEFVATAGLVVVMVIFMLLRRQELRNRLIRLIGYGQLTTTTAALDEAAGRISRYLLMQSMLNAVYGLGIGASLFLLGLPYALLWGFLAGMLRFIPYVGPWLGAALPVLLSLAFFQGWLYPVIIVAIFVGLELLVSMILEPLLYGHSAGVSEVALLIAVAFWTWVWGPIGLALATPLTVCVVVLAKYVPGLDFVQVLFGDEPLPEPHLVFYQRLLAKDAEEPAQMVRKFLDEHGSDEIYDRLFLPALIAAKRDYNDNKLPEQTLKFVLDETRRLITTVDPQTPIPPPARPKSALLDGATDSVPEGEAMFFGLPARDAFDELVLLMLKQLLTSSRYSVEVVSSEKMSGEMIDMVEERHPSVVCVGAVFPSPAGVIRSLCRRLREKFPDLKIMVGKWQLDELSQEDKDDILASGADSISHTLQESRSHAIHLQQMLSPEEQSLQSDSKLVSPARQPAASSA